MADNAAGPSQQDLEKSAKVRSFSLQTSSQAQGWMEVFIQPQLVLPVADRQRFTDVGPY